MRWVATFLALVLLGLQVLSVPFYAGASGETFAWRLEHGRLTLERDQRNRPQGLWIAPNAEGLRWAPEARRYGPGSWRVTVPLWTMFLVALVVAVLGHGLRGRDERLER